MEIFSALTVWKGENHRWLHGFQTQSFNNLHFYVFLDDLTLSLDYLATVVTDLQICS